MAPQVGLEPTTLRLTAECSAIELLRNKRPHIVSEETMQGAKRFYSRRVRERQPHTDPTHCDSNSEKNVRMLNATVPVKRDAGRRTSVRIPRKDCDFDIGSIVHELVLDRQEKGLRRDRCGKHVDRETVNLVGRTEEVCEGKRNLSVVLS